MMVKYNKIISTAISSFKKATESSSSSKRRSELWSLVITIIWSFDHHQTVKSSDFLIIWSWNSTITWAATLLNVKDSTAPTTPKSSEESARLNNIEPQYSSNQKFNFFQRHRRKKPKSEFLVSRGREASYGLGQIGIEYKRSNLRKPIHHSSQTKQTQKIPRFAPTVTFIQLIN